MLLKIEVFPPPAGKGSQASQTLYVSPSTVMNRYGAKGNDGDDDATDQEEEESNPNAGLVATIGRKGDVDILFGTDRSISRQHAMLRLVASKRKKPKRKGRGKAAAKDNSENQGCSVEPRNDGEQSACDESPYGMCLVLENKGKSGSYIPSRDESIGTETMDDDKHKDGHDSDATTDDEGTSANIPQSSQRNYGTATSLTTQLGEVIVSRTKLSSSQKLPSLSDAIQDHFGNETPVQLTKIDADESLVLKLDGSLGKDSNDLSVLVQFGCALLPTIKITLIPMVVVFSSGIPSSIQESLRLCGGLAQEPGSLPRNEKDPTTKTTHLVATERVAVAKQLIAWCYGVPIVSPDFLVALRKHSSLQDSFPKVADYSPTATDTNDFWDWKPDPKLLQNYTMISVDPSPEVEQAEGLALAAGASLEKLYEPKKKPTKAKIQIYTERCNELLQEAADASPPKTVVLLASKTKSKYSNNNTTNFLKHLREELSIPSVGSKILAKTITKQEAFLVGLEPNAPSTASTNNNARPNATDTNMVDAEQTPQSPEWQLRNTVKSPLKREHEEVCKEKAATEMKGNSSNVQRNSKRTPVAEKDKPTSEESRSSKRRRVEPLKQEDKDDDENDFILPADDDDPVSLEANCNDEPQSSTNHNSNKIIAFEKADSNGWFTAAPKDDRERSRLRKRAAEVYQKETGIALEPSASTGFTIHVDPMADSTNQISNEVRGGYAMVRQRNNDNVPNFKRFRKNNVPRTDPEEVVILVDATFTNGNTPEEVSAEELEMRENQRLAEALFNGEPVPGMVKKKRRARN